MNESATSSVPDPAARRRSIRLVRLLVLVAAGLILFLGTVWAVAALHFDVRINWLRTPLTVLYAVGMLLVWIFAKHRWQAVVVTVGGFLIVLGWWLTLQPSNDRDWQPDLAVLPYAELNGDRVTIHNIRNCDYRTETDFDVHHYNRTFDLAQLQSVELYMVYWGSPMMAHTMMTFGFGNDDYVTFSIETRKEKGEAYSAVKGLFRQFEITYVVSDERDVVRLRTNYRQGEEVYLYRLRSTPELRREVFLDYVHRINQLHERPEWYNAITDNCTTGIRAQRASAKRAPWDWRILVNGYGNELLYARGRINTNFPLAELKERGHVNARARAADRADYSRLIRIGVPDIDDQP